MTDPKLYDLVRCAVCGTPWLTHDATCSRHPYRPSEAETRRAMERLVEWMPNLPRLPESEPKPEEAPHP